MRNIVAIVFALCGHLWLAFWRLLWKVIDR